MHFQTSVPNTWIQAQVTLARYRPRLRSAELIGDRECDCGQLKVGQVVACKRCRFLDGEYRLEQRIIAVLRMLDEPTSLKELTLLVGVTDRSMLRALNRLRSIGRARRIWGDPETPKARFGFQHAQNAGTTLVGAGRWLYRLWG
jgi:hypothetical protein